MIELDEKSLIVLGQIVREVGKADDGQNDLMLGKFVQKVVNHLNEETQRNMREEVNKGQSDAV